VEEALAGLFTQRECQANPLIRAAGFAIPHRKRRGLSLENVHCEIGTTFADSERAGLF
jgi:hypothetical protein